MTDPRKVLADPDAEAAVLSAMLMSGSALAEAAGILDAEAFTTTPNALTFAALVALRQREVEPDPVALAAVLREQGELAHAGGHERIADLMDAVPTAANVAYHARIVRELAERRRLLALADELSSAALDRSVDLSETGRSAVEQLLPTVAGNDTSKGFQRADYWPVMEAIEARGNGTTTALLTGLPELDDVIHGFQPGELVIVGGVAKGGKTTLALTMARHAMLERAASVAFVSAEMTRSQLLERLLNAEAGVPVGRTSSGKLWPDDYPRMARAAGVLASAKLYIDDAALPSLEDIDARALALVAKEGPVDLAVVDFLQLVQKIMKGRSTADELSAVSYGLKGLGKRLGCPVIAPCQLNYKDVGRRANAHPTFEDLAGSSGMMQAADFVILTHRPAMYDPCAGDDIELTVRGRRIPDFTATLRWEGQYMRVVSPLRSPRPDWQQQASNDNAA
ncbi:MAG TPA: DnaB-like helicase C-terminal domain-containing protein [Gemmatimonadaceae bacterium]|nr:DnaB-like helicase C-terminal domain-containing protein [Gemmatimonadaceae bacterium]